MRLEADMIALTSAKKAAEEAALSVKGELAEAIEKYKAEWNERKRIFNQVFCKRSAHISLFWQTS